MEDLAPPLKALIEIKTLMEAGCGPNQSIRIYIDENKTDLDEFSQKLQMWFLRRNLGKELDLSFWDSIQSPLQVSFFQLLNESLSGVPVLERLEGLKAEMIEAAKDELDLHLRRLPMLCLLPVLLLQFPAFLLLLFGPLMTSLIQQMGGG